MVDISATILLGLRLVMAAALYAFLGWCVMVLWRDLKNQAQSLSKQKVPAVEISLMDGDGKREELRFTSPEIVIGRHPSCEWVLANETVSSRHARMVYHHDQWWLEDMNSRNGTFLNGSALDAPAVLADQDEVRCGQVSFSVKFDDGLEEIKNEIKA
jgi:pSer/pThr/pTyr-binding forkhead associated (FHA) protein